MNRRTRKPRRPQATRNPERTRQRVLESALVEFADKGLAGARVDAIARRAGVNKRMLYHYFGDKAGLFSAVLAHKVAQREALLASAPEDPAAMLAHWFDAACNDVNWFRLLGWEALQPHGRKVVHEDYRVAVCKQAVAQVRRQQASGLLPADLDPEQLLLSMMALTAYPLAFPQVTRLVTGLTPSDPVFQKERLKFLKQFARLLDARPPEPASPRRRTT